MLAPTSIDSVLVLVPLPDRALDAINAAVNKVHYYPDGDSPAEAQSSAEVIFCSWSGPHGIDSVSQTPKLKHIQVITSGVEQALTHPAVKEAMADERDITISSSVGIHAASIPEHCVAMAINLLHRIDTQLYISRHERRWADRPEFPSRAGPNYVAKSLRGKTVGLLGYGHLGRETARLLKPFGVDIIAANTSGKATVDEGWILPGTGDRGGIIPSAYYSSSDSSSFCEFLRRSQILICSLPSTPKTARMIGRNELGLLPDDAIFINVGRGNLVSSEDLLEALDSNLLGVALDVTDPEPLPNNHPLYSHPNAIITPHLAGDAEGEREMATELLVANIERIRKGEKPYNVVRRDKGY